MPYFISLQTHPGLPSGQGGAASPGSSLDLYSAGEPVVVASGGGPLNQKAEQVAPVTQAWGPPLAMPEVRGFPGGASWETLWWKEYSQYCHEFPDMRQPESMGLEDGCSRSRAPPLGGPSRLGPLLLCGLSPGVLPMPAEVEGKEASTHPDICILTLAMMIAGIPTVPVPGLREEDLIQAAQAFMMAHPEPEVSVDEAPGEPMQAYKASGKVPLVRSRRGQPPGSCL
ncbi:hypothetical protein MC885_006317 [Smutsia gigantea]|nr:hypothetical protein MC885_006317 [Smutsia gigantea]